MMEPSGLNVVVFSDALNSSADIWVHFREPKSSHVASIHISPQSGNILELEIYPFYDWDWLGMHDTARLDLYLQSLNAAQQIAVKLIADRPIGLAAVQVFVDEVIAQQHLEVRRLDQHEISRLEWYDIYKMLEAHPDHTES